MNQNIVTFHILSMSTILNKKNIGRIQNSLTNNDAHFVNICHANNFVLIDFFKNIFRRII